MTSLIKATMDIQGSHGIAVNISDLLGFPMMLHSC